MTKKDTKDKWPGRIEFFWFYPQQTTDTQLRQKSTKSEILGRCGRQNMLRPYLKIWDWDLIFGLAVKAISSLGVRSPWLQSFGFLSDICSWLGFWNNFLEKEDFIIGFKTFWNAFLKKLKRGIWSSSLPLEYQTVWTYNIFYKIVNKIENSNATP